MADQSEHRGWEIEDNWEQHWADDADVELTDYTEGSAWSLVFGLILLVALGSGLWVLRLWLTPPTITLSPIVVQQAYPTQSQQPFILPEGWRPDCIAFDGKKKLMRPNWDIEKYISPELTIRRHMRVEGCEFSETSWTIESPVLTGLRMVARRER